MSIITAVIPAAGLGTRFLPASKAVPKEMFPLGDRPIIHHVVDEAAASGIRHVVIITGPGKEAIEAYFSPAPGLERRLKRTGKSELLEPLTRLLECVRFSFVLQEEPLGLGHAVLTAREIVGGETFAVMLPDDVFEDPVPCLKQLITVHHQLHGGVIALKEVSSDLVSRFGMIRGEDRGNGIFSIQGLVEKPPVGSAPSNLAVIGRYILPPEIFDCLEQTKPGALGEMQLTDGLRLLASRASLFGHRFSGIHHDAGEWPGYLESALRLTLEQGDRASGLRTLLERLASQDKGTKT